MASTLHAAIGAAVALLFWTSLGLTITRRVVPALALPMAPVVGWAVHSAIALPIFFVLAFSAMHVTAVAGVMFLAAVAIWLARAPADAIATTVPPWAYALAALLALAPSAAILPKLSGDAVYLAAPIFDHAKVALVDEMMKFGVPPGNPFFGDAFPRLSYYYLWHFSAAELALAAGISGWEADVAMTWFSAFASLAMMMGLGVWLGGRAAAVLVVILSATASARTVPEWIFGSENVEAVVGRAAGFGGWLFQTAWVPQHVMSATCAVAAVILMSEMARRGSMLLVMTLALMIAAGFESSTWIGGVTFAIAAPVVAIAIAGRLGPWRRLLFIAALAAAAVLAMCFATLLLRDQLAVTAGKSSPIALEFYPVLELYFSDSLRVLLDPPAFWIVLLPIELPAVYVIGMIALVRLFSSRKFQDDRSSVVRAVAALALSSLAVCWLLTSTLGENDDLGWRAVLLAAMALTVLAAAGVSWWMAARAGIAVTAAGIAIILGLPDGIDMIRCYVSGQTAPAARLFAASPQLWAAVRRHAGPSERVGNNPLFLQAATPWPVNISWALLSDRRSCFAGRELALVYTTLGYQRTAEINAQFIRVFAGNGSPADVQQLATKYDCQVIVVTAADGAWKKDPFAASSRYRLVDESAEQWRIYRAIEEDDSGL
jgi:hypothetical protein